MEYQDFITYCEELGCNIDNIEPALSMITHRMTGGFATLEVMNEVDNFSAILYCRALRISIPPQIDQSDFPEL